MLLTGGIVEGATGVVEGTCCQHRACSYAQSALGADSKVMHTEGPPGRSRIRHAACMHASIAHAQGLLGPTGLPGHQQWLSGQRQ